MFATEQQILWSNLLFFLATNPWIEFPTGKQQMHLLNISCQQLDLRPTFLILPHLFDHR